jgi:hypothetical protein
VSRHELEAAPPSLPALYDAARRALAEYRKLQAQVRAAEQSPDLYELKRRAFHDGDRQRGGNA